jgi:hypothetical protein
MQRTGSTAELPRDVPPREPFLRWLGTNVIRLAVYLGIVSVVLGSMTVLTDPSSTGVGGAAGSAAVFFLVGGLSGIPGTTVWLLIVSMLPTEWSSERRRLVALATTPLIQIVLLLAFLEWGFTTGVVVIGLLLPAGSAFIVHLRERMPSSPFPPEDQLGQELATG